MDFDIEDGRDIYNPDSLMADGGDYAPTAAEEILNYLLLEVVKAPDDIPYSARRAGFLIEKQIRRRQIKAGPLSHAFQEELTKMGIVPTLSADIVQDALSRVLVLMYSKDAE